MKKNIMLWMLAMAAPCLFCVSCNKDNDGEDGDGGKKPSNYWESNALTRFHILGNVKTVKTYYDGSETPDAVVEFNKDGNILSETYYWNDNPDVTEYEYNSAGILVSKSFKTPYSDFVSKETYEYNNLGYYLPMQPFHVMESGLVNGISKVTNEYEEGKEDVTLIRIDGDSVRFTDEYDGETYVMGVMALKDKYVYKTADGVQMFMGPIEYMDNGMFSVYHEGFDYREYNEKGEWIDGSYTYRTYNYKKFGDYMLLDSWSEEYQSVYYDNDKRYENHDFRSTKNTYDSNGFLIQEKETYSDGYNQHNIIEYRNTYDSKGNPTEIVTIYNGDESRATVARFEYIYY